MVLLSTLPLVFVRSMAQFKSLSNKTVLLVGTHFKLCVMALSGNNALNNLNTSLTSFAELYEK